MNSNETAFLRQKALERLKKSPFKEKVMPKEDEILKIIHELDVHEVELEMQNEELQIANEKAESATKKAELAAAKYTSLYDLAPTGYFTLECNGIILDLNLCGAKQLGKERSELINRNFKLFVNKDSRLIINEFLQNIFESKSNGSCEVRLENEGAPSVYIHIEGVVHEKSQNCLMTTVDISERMLIEEKMSSALREKEVLISELFHRTKNNMQVICSLLKLKSETVKDNDTKIILADMSSRIRTIALVHEILYKSKNLSRIDLKDYITDLVNLIKDNFHSSNNIDLLFELESIKVLIDIAIPCGLIINELVSNAFKYAFPEGVNGEIRVQLLRIDKDTIELKVSDNGIGISKELNIMNSDKIGGMLLKHVAEDQLQGDVSLNVENGSSWTIRFKDNLFVERV